MPCRNTTRSGKPFPDLLLTFVVFLNHLQDKFLDVRDLLLGCVGSSTTLSDLTRSCGVRACAISITVGFFLGNSQEFTSIHAHDVYDGRIVAGSFKQAASRLKVRRLVDIEPIQEFLETRKDSRFIIHQKNPFSLQQVVCL